MEKTKILALYLPQYYETDYNNEWWGVGYTEWTACKQAKPLIKKQYQPRSPLDNNYYDLSKIESIESQIQMARQYGIDGFVIYQYYSCNSSQYGEKCGENGSLLLDLPLNIFAGNKQLQFPFCLYWANHDWKKAWFGQDETVVWPQQYGDEKDWEDFFNHNLRYFKDERYIKINNRPVFFIFATWHFKRIQEFKRLWNDLALQNGFDGIFFVATEDARNKERVGEFDAFYRREPFYTFAKGFGKMSFIKRVIRTRVAKVVNRLFKKSNKGVVGYLCDYSKAWNSIISREYSNNKIIPGVFVDWDNTPRKQFNAQILTGFSPDLFGHFFDIFYSKCCKNDVPFLVINAWNEWAEGAYLEPDDKYGYACLEKIKSIKSKTN